MQINSNNSVQLMDSGIKKRFFFFAEIMAEFEIRVRCVNLGKKCSNAPMRRYETVYLKHTKG